MQVRGAEIQFRLHIWYCYRLYYCGLSVLVTYPTPQKNTTTPYGVCNAMIVDINMETGQTIIYCTRVGLHYYLPRLSYRYPQGVVAIDAAQLITWHISLCFPPTEACSEIVIRPDNRISQHSPLTRDPGIVGSGHIIIQRYVLRSTGIWSWPGSDGGRFNVFQINVAPRLHWYHQVSFSRWWISNLLPPEVHSNGVVQGWHLITTPHTGVLRKKKSPDQDSPTPQTWRALHHQL